MNLSLPNAADAVAAAEAILADKPAEYDVVEDHGPYFYKWGYCAGANQVIYHQVPRS